MPFLHTELASGRWQTLSLAEQMGNIGSEIGRALAWRGKDQKIFFGAVDRVLELFDLTMQDFRWRGRLKEVARAREIFCDTVQDGGNYGDSLESLDRYFFYFSFFARMKK